MGLNSNRSDEMKLSTLIALIVLFFATSSCALLGLEEEDITSTANIGSISDLQGTWVIDCEAPSEGAQYEKSSIQFSETGFVTESTYYQDSSCSSNLYKNTLTYTSLTVGESWDNLGYKFTGSFQSYTKTPMNDTWTSYYNSSSGLGCGLTNWQTNVPQEITGTSCTTIEKNNVITNWYKLTGSSLVLANDGKTYTKQ